MRRLFWTLLSLLCLCNLADLVLTLRALEAGAREVNPVMAFYISLSPWVFVAAKLILVGAGSAVFIYLRQHPLTLWGLGFLSAIYLVVLGIHLGLLMAA